MFERETKTVPTHHLRPGDKVKQKVTFNNGKKPTSPKWMEWQEDIEFTVTSRRTKDGAIVAIAKGTNKLRRSYDLICHLTENTTSGVDFKETT